MHTNDQIGLTHTAIGSPATDPGVGASGFAAAAFSGIHGAVLQFLGVVRGVEAGQPIQGIRYSAYEAMATSQLQGIVKAARTRAGVDFPVRLVHRLGFVPVGEASVVLEVATPHSREAYEFAQGILHGLKTAVPIWKEFVNS